MLIIFGGGDGMAGSYGDLIRMARKAQSPPITAKQLADKLKVSAPFITDIEKNRRLPSLQNQEKIKMLLACPWRRYSRLYFSRKRYHNPSCDLSYYKIS